MNLNTVQCAKINRELLAKVDMSRSAILARIDKVLREADKDKAYRKAHRVKYITFRFPNTPEGLNALKAKKIEMKKTYYKGGRTNFRVYGRCKNVREVFEKTGRRFKTNTPMSNDITLKTPEAKYCYEWVLYVKPVVKVKKRA